VKKVSVFFSVGSMEERVAALEKIVAEQADALEALRIELSEIKEAKSVRSSGGSTASEASSIRTRTTSNTSSKSPVRKAAPAPRATSPMREKSPTRPKASATHARSVTVDIGNLSAAKPTSAGAPKPRSKSPKAARPSDNRPRREKLAGSHRLKQKEVKPLIHALETATKELSTASMSLKGISMAPLNLTARLMLNVASFVCGKPSDFLSMQLTCKSWWSVCESPRVWTAVAEAGQKQVSARLHMT
jgi:type IV secretory pathway TrbL component